MMATKPRRVVTRPNPPAIGAFVRTPTGRTAIVIELHRPEREATIQWIDDMERARFRWALLWSSDRG